MDYVYKIDMYLGEGMIGYDLLRKSSENFEKNQKCLNGLRIALRASKEIFEKSSESSLDPSVILGDFDK